jgi:hypothetical protein
VVCCVKVVVALGVTDAVDCDFGHRGLIVEIREDGGVAGGVDRDFFLCRGRLVSGLQW